MRRRQRAVLAASAAAALLIASTAAAQAESAQATTEQAAPAAAVQAFPYPVHEQTLDNGLKVVVIPYDSPGIVAYFTVVRTGSRQEVEAGHSGFAHFFEHMMFRGTDRYSADEYNDVLKRIGADSNAFTTDDYTNYYIIGPSSELETMMDIESDRFQNLEYSEDVFRTEALAILGEYNKNVSSPFLPMYERLRELAFQKHTYQHTTMGFLEDIQAMPGYYDYSLSFFDRFYRPENTVLLVVGDVEPRRVHALARKYYGSWEKGYKPVTIEAEPEQKKEQTARLDWPTPTRPHVMVGYHVGAFDAAGEETAALDLIAQLLFSDSAPLYQELVVDKQWVDTISGDAAFRRDPYLFTIVARVKSEELVPKVMQTVESHIARLQQEKVDPARLERIKSHLRYQFALGLDSPGAVAFSAANMLNLTGEVEPINTLYARYQKVTPEEIQRVARRVFQPERRTVVTLAHRAPEVAPADSTTTDGAAAEAGE
ncbi:MAG TPA: pitrilysin family protein [Thermoanaerobaculia bacterium]|nr:pitrilysin family protein [Thermoanaerobaculia bacterium]